MKMRGESFLPGLLALALLPWLAVPAQQPPPAADPARRLVVTFDGGLEDLPDMKPEEFQIELNKQKVAPKKLYNPEELPTLIAIVLQENIRQNFGTQMPALRDFILAQPQNTYVGVFYLAGDSIDNPTNGFQADLKKVAEVLRAPKGQAELAPPSPYTLIGKLGDWMNKMPAARKEILLFSEGTDAIYPDASPGQNRNVRVALDRTRDFGIPVWVVYTDAFAPATRRQVEGDPFGGSEQGATGPTSASSGVDPRSMNDASVGGRSTDVSPGRGSDPFAESSTRPRVSFNIANLKELADKSGGKMLSSKEALTDIVPLLEEFRTLLSRQLVLEYDGEPPVKKVKMNRKLQGVKLLAPER
ncbi:MAG: hypothetical protein ACRD4U_00585 [Candidatus Acidiferrales bacterium]